MQRFRLLPNYFGPYYYHYDDFVIAVICRICVLGVLVGVTDFESSDAEGQGQGQGQGEGQTDDGGCGAELRRNSVGFLVTLCVTLLLELAVAVVSMRGSILNVQPRSVMPYLLYARLRMSLNHAISSW